MKVLLDTYALIWIVDGSSRIGPLTREAVQSARSVVVADASLWEIAVKTSIGKLRTKASLAAEVRRMGFERLPFADRYFETLSSLPLHHRDPFDRMLIAVALADDFTVVTSDPVFTKYGVRAINARE